jgi:hypothetical protein
MTDKRDLQEELAQFRGLVLLPAWRQLMDYAAQQLTGRIDTIILNPVESADRTYQQEYLKGEVSGIKLFTKMPEILIAELEDALNSEKGE